MPHAPEGERSSTDSTARSSDGATFVTASQFECGTSSQPAQVSPMRCRSWRQRRGEERPPSYDSMSGRGSGGRSHHRYRRFFMSGSA